MQRAIVRARRRDPNDDLIAARKMASEMFPTVATTNFVDGKADGGGAVQWLLAGIRRGRNIEQLRAAWLVEPAPRYAKSDANGYTADRVAKAIAGTSRIPWADMPASMRLMYVEAARAAIMAMNDTPESRHD